MPSLPLLAGRYRLQSQIAAGGVGEVWRAEDTLLTRPVAVKLLRAEYAGHPETMARFRAEARHAGALSHAAIARVYDYGDPVPPLPAFLVMELVDGPSLAAILSIAPLGAAQTMDVVAQVAAGLQMAHAAGLVHRDIKPANLLLGSDGQVKITDFGIAHVAGAVPVTRTGIVMGTPAYLAPERVSGASATPAADLYSLGVVAYECLAGAAPFAGKPLEVAVAHRDLPLPPFPHPVPARVARLIGEMTAKDPAARPASAQEVATRASLLRDDIADGVAGGAASWQYNVPAAAGILPARRAVARGPASPDPTLEWQPAPAKRTGLLAPADGPAPDRRRPRPARPPTRTTRSRRTRWITVGASTAAVAAVAAVALLMTSSPGRTPVSAVGKASATSQPPAAAPSPPATRSPSPAATTPVVPATVEVTAATLVGQPVEQVRQQLQTLGLVVQVHHNPSHQQTGTVLAVMPSGKVRKASVVVVTVAVMQFQDGHNHDHHHHGDGSGGQTVMSTGAMTARSGG